MDKRLQPFLASVPCRRCTSNAYWAVDGQPLCYACLCSVASVSKAQTDLVHDALISPELVSVSSSEVKLRIYDTTAIAPICSMLNRLQLLFPEMDVEAEIIIERWQNRPMPLGADQIVCTGMGYYFIDSRTLGPVRCNAPLIKLARAPIGRMSGFMHELNEYSKRIRECIAGRADGGGSVNDGTIDYIPVHKVEPTGLPLRCQRCSGSNAHWVVDNVRLCHLCLLDLSGLDTDYERDLFEARISPELVAVHMNEVQVRVFGSTAVAPLCKLLNTLPKSVGIDTEIHIEFWQARGIGCTARLMLEGEGWYTIESRTVRHHAPLIRLARPPRGKMAGFMKMLNDHSTMVCRRMAWEHTGEAPNA